MVNDSIDNLRLDINKPKARVSLSVRKGDTKTRTIHVSLTSNGAVYSLENVLIAELLINKPDGKVCDQDMVIKGNELQYTFRTQDTNVEGECVCQIRLMFKDGAYLVSPEFYMYVYNMILDNKTSKSENEYSHTDALLVKANAYYENAETLSKQVEDSVTEASGYADAAEGFKDDAEAAQTAAETAQTAAETAKTAAETAKTGAEAALASAQAIDTDVSTLKATCQQAVTDCKTEVTNAKTEVSNAAAQVTLATNQAVLAAASATAAATSAINAATSESNALGYAQDALQSELHAKQFKEDAEAAKNDLESKLIVATATTAGLVKPDGVTTTVAADGTISATGSGAIASTTTLGAVKVDGTTITADADGTIHGADITPIATTAAVGTVKPDGSTITVAADGTISATDTTPIATTSTAGIVIPDGTTITVDALGNISAVDATPVATTAAVGTVKPDGTTITVEADGTISATGTISPIATTTTAGIVIPDGTTITVDALGNISAVDATPIATTSVAGIVIPDGTTITVDASGKISAVDTTPIATTATVGTVKPDGSTITVAADGTISAVDATPIATTTTAGTVIPDGTTITVDGSGNIAAVQQDADDVAYTNTTSGLTATDVQAAIDEVNTSLYIASDSKNIKFGKNGDGDYGYYKADGSFIPFKSSNADLPYIAPEYDETATYNTDDTVIYDGLLYVCKEDEVSGTWDSTKWDKSSLVEVSNLNQSSGGDLEPVLLWTNSNISSSFGAQTISLDLSDYVGVIVEGVENSTDNTVQSARTYVKKTDGTSAYIGIGGYISTSPWTRSLRGISVTDDGVTFQRARISGGDYNDAASIPTKIYGVKSYLVEPTNGHVNYKTTTTKSYEITQIAVIDVSNTTSVTLNFTYHYNGSSTMMWYGLGTELKNTYAYDNYHGNSAAGLTMTTNDASLTLDTTGYTYAYIEQRYGTQVTDIEVIYN